MNKTIIALISGVAIGLLLAPAKGSETLNRVTGRLSDLKDRFKVKAEDMFITGEDILQKEKPGTVL